MKLKLFLAVCVLCALSVSAFAKKSQKKSSSERDFKVVYDDVSDVTRITHVDMELKELGQPYNLRDMTLNERENIRLCITDKLLVMYADYQHNTDWLFIESVVFLDGKGGRLKIDNGKLRKEVKNILNQSVIRERYMKILDGTAASQLYDILQADKPTVSFVGSQYHTDKLVIKPKVKAAMLATIEYWRGLQSEHSEQSD